MSKPTVVVVRPGMPLTPLQKLLAASVGVPGVPSGASKAVLVSGGAVTIVIGPTLPQPFAGAVGLPGVARIWG